VVIPFFNPAANIEDCLASMVSQTLDRSRFEVVLVDDGSTDGTPARVAEWVARYPELMSVHRIPATGWPGRPRNVGVGLARGRYVHFVDSDDSLAPRALERVLEVADESDADVVVGKLSSDFRGINHPLFRTTVTRRTLADFPIVHNLTIHKMFRREFLLAHDIRFAEGPRHVEDEHVCVQAYVHAKSVAIVGDTACYFYRRRRTGGRNLGDTLIVPSEYYRDLGYVLDVTDLPTVAPAARRNVEERVYRTEMLGRLRGSAMLDYDPDYRAEMVAEVRRLTVARIPTEIHDQLPAMLRIQSRLLRNDDVDGLLAYAEQLDSVRLRAVSAPPRWEGGHLVVGIDAQLYLGDEPLRLERVANSWAIPTSLAPGVDVAERTLGPRDDVELDLDLATNSQVDSQSWSTTEGLTLEIDDAGHPVIRGDVRLDPWSLSGGESLPAGLWDLRLRVAFSGLRRTSPVRPRDGELPRLGSWLTPGGDSLHSVAAYWTEPSATLALDVDEWTHSLHDLVADPPDEPARIESRRRLVIPTSALRGSAGSVTSAQLILEPSGGPALGLSTCAAALRLGPDGSSIEATIPRLPSSAASWAVWLRIGEIGGAPARRLPIELRQNRLGRLHVTPSR
jgi:poly(ribitol-phosphate) beta-N-acetylglucosaminyltransferase